MEAFLDVKTAAEKLGVSDYTLKDRMKAGTFPGAKVSGRWVVRLSDVEKAKMIEPKFLDNVLRTAGITANASQRNKLIEAIHSSVMKIEYRQKF